MKKSLLLVAVSAVFMFLSCGNGADFDPVDLMQHHELFEWYGEFPCGDDWEFGYETGGVKDNILEVTVKEHDKEPDVTAKCAGCCHVMPMVYEGKSEEEITAIKGVKVSYKEHNYEVTFEF